MRAASEEAENTRNGLPGTLNFFEEKRKKFLTERAECVRMKEFSAETFRADETAERPAKTPECTL